MKIFLLSPSVSGHEAEASLIADTTILRSGRPYYIPDWDEQFSLHPTLAFRIDKLGKSIAARFASRYIAAMAPAAIALPGAAMKALKAGEALRAMQCAYDYAMPLGAWQEIDGIPADVEVTVLGVDGAEAQWHLKDLALPIEQRLEQLSRRFTIKTGDIIVAPPATTGLPLQIGAKVEICIDGKPAFIVPVK